MKAVSVHKGEVYCACALPGSTGLVATAGHDGNVVLWERCGKSKKVESLHNHLIRCLAACQYGDEVYFITASWDSTLKVFTSAGALVCTLHGHTNRVKALTVMSKRAECSEARTPLVVSGADDHTIRVWDLLSGDCVHCLHDAHNHFILALCAFPCSGAEGLTFASASSDKTIKLWAFPSSTTPTPLLVLDECDDVVTCMLHCPFKEERELEEGGGEGGGAGVGGFIACGTTGGAIKIWSTLGPSLLHHIPPAHTGRVTALCQPALLPGDVLLSVGVDGRLASWSMLQGAQGSISLDVAQGDRVELLACCCSPPTQSQPLSLSQAQAQAQVQEEPPSSPREEERGAPSPDPSKAYGLLTEDLYLCMSDGRVLVLELATVTSPSSSSHAAAARHFLSSDKDGRDRWDAEGEPQSPPTLAVAGAPAQAPAVPRAVNVMVAARPNKSSAPAPAPAPAPAGRPVKLPQIARQPAAPRKPLVAASAMVGRAPIAVLAETEGEEKDKDEDEMSLPSSSPALLGLAATGSRKPSSQHPPTLPPSRRRSPPILRPPALGSVGGSAGLYQLAREESAVVEEVAQSALLLQAVLSSTRTSKLGRSPLSAAMQKINRK